jgi:hypothetical protein
MSLSFKKKEPTPNGSGSSGGMAKARNLHAAKGNDLIKTLESKAAEYEAEAKKCMRKGPDYNEKLARTYFANIAVIKEKIASIKTIQAQSDVLVATVQADNFTADTADFMAEAAREQKTAAKRVDLDRVDRIAGRMNTSRMDLDEASKKVNGAMGELAGGLLKTKLDNDDEEDIGHQLSKSDPQMNGFDHDFLMWSQTIAADLPPAAPSAVPSFSPGVALPKEEPDYVKTLREMVKEGK